MPYLCVGGSTGKHQSLKQVLSAPFRVEVQDMVQMTCDMSGADVKDTVVSCCMEEIKQAPIFPLFFILLGRRTSSVSCDESGHIAR